MKQRGLHARILAVVLAIVVAQPAWLLAVTQGPHLPDPGNVGVSKQEQIQLGQKAMGEVYQQMPVLPDSSPVSQYVQQLGKRLERVIPQQYSWPYQFHVVQQKEINAFAIPGGPIFINVGTITAADNEAELAGVMAHEMSHVYMQHSIKAMQKQGMTQGLAGLIGGILGSVLGGTAGALANMGFQYAGGILSLKYSRADEAQADSVGAIIMYLASYNPKAMAEFFQKLEKQGGGGGPQFLSDHPNPGNRVAAVEKEIQDWPPKNYQNNSPDFVRAKQDASRVKAYTAEQIAQGAKSGLWVQENRKNGAIPANVQVPSGPGGSASNGAGGGTVLNVSYEQVRPSGSFRQYQNGRFSIDYPSNWQVNSDQNNGITIAPAAGVAQGAIAYGVIIGEAQDPNATTLDQATQDLMQGMVQSNPGLRPQGNPRPIQVNGIEGRSAMLIGNSPVEQNGRPLAERDWLVTLADPRGGLLYLVFIAPDRDFSRLQPTYERMLNSLQVR